MIREIYIYIYWFVAFLFSLCVLNSFQYTDFWNSLLRSFINFWFSFADNVTTETCNFVSLIVKVIVLELAPLLSLAFAEKAQYFVHLSFNSTLQLINGISSDLYLRLIISLNPVICYIDNSKIWVKKKQFKITLRLIKIRFIGLLRACNTGGFFRSLAFNPEEHKKCVSLDNRPCQARPTIAGISSNESLFLSIYCQY